MLFEIAHQAECAVCGCHFATCTPCWYPSRKYCSDSCRREARRVQYRLSSLRYQNTKMGKLKHALRQATYRLKKVTQHIGKNVASILRKVSLPLTHCAFCGREVHLQIQP